MRETVKKLIRVLAIGGLCAVLYLAWFAFESTGASDEARFLFAGTQRDADCAILLSRDQCVLIDTGEAADAEHILNLLEEEKVGQIDCMILTHPDQDHVGGAAAILEALPVKQIITPYFPGKKTAYQTAMDRAEELRIPVFTLSRDRQFVFGELKLRIFPPEKFYYDNSNNYSLAVLAEHGEVSLFFTGDAERARLTELLEIKLPKKIDLYKAAHHGRSSQKGAELIAALTPKAAVITAEKAEPQIASAFAQEGTELYSALGQDVIFHSDGSSLAWIQSRPIV